MPGAAALPKIALAALLLPDATNSAKPVPGASACFYHLVLPAARPGGPPTQLFEERKGWRDLTSGCAARSLESRSLDSGAGAPFGKAEHRCAQKEA